MNMAILVSRLFVSKARAFEKACANPMVAQEKVLLEYLHRNESTEYGRRYGFNKIKTISDYQRFVPIGDSESMSPFIDRMKKGEHGMLTAEDPIFFGLTSGTTDKPKYIPVTRFSRDKKAQVAGLWAYYIARDHPKVLEGKILAVISPEIEGVTESGIPYGAESGHAYRNLPWFASKLYALPAEVWEIKDYESRYYCVLRIAVEQNITTLATLNPSMIILLCQRLILWKHRIIDDISNGTLDAGINIPDKIRKTIEKRLRPNAERAETLITILRKKGELLPKYFWPNLALIECWKGGAVKAYLKDIPRYLGEVPIRDFGCLSTEARSSIPMSDFGAGGVLAIETNFYEFVEKDEMARPDARVLTCDQLEVGKDYYLIVTTPGGLYRYNIDDVIRVDGYFNKTPMIEFMQKGMNAVSITGEKIYESQVSEALTKTLDLLGLSIKFLTAYPEFGSPSRYAFLVEFEYEPDAKKKKEFLTVLDEELKNQNSEYRDIRAGMLLGSPILKRVKKGGFEAYRARKVDEGTHDTQFKLPELTKDEFFWKNFEVEEEVG